MEYKVIFSPEMDVNPKDFAKVWHSAPECREIAQAEVSKTQDTQFDMGATAVILIGIGTSIAGTALFEQIKKLFERRGKHKDIDFIQIDQSDGTHIIAVKIKEG